MPCLLEGAGSFRLDLNLINRIRIGEHKELHLRADAVNATNSPQFEDPASDINSPNFRRITRTDGNQVVCYASSSAVHN